MHLIRVGGKCVNLKYLMMDEEIGEGKISVTLATGRAFTLAGDEAEQWRRTICRYVEADGPARTVSHGFPVDPPEPADVGDCDAVG
jgi:hypothetical protein